MVRNTGVTGGPANTGAYAKRRKKKKLSKRKSRRPVGPVSISFSFVFRFFFVTSRGQSSCDNEYGNFNTANSFRVHPIFNSNVLSSSGIDHQSINE